MLLVFLPVALVACSFDVRVDTVAIGLVIEPLSIIDITVCVEELALTASLVILPITFVASVVGPDHGPASMSQASLPLTGVNRSCLVRMHSSLQGCISRIGAIKGLPRLIALEVLTLNLACHLQDAIFPSLKEATDE